MSRQLAAVAPRTHREDGSPCLRLVSSRVLDEGLSAVGYSAEAFAKEAEMSAGILSEMRSGARPVHFHLVLQLLKNERSAPVVLGQLCGFSGYALGGLKTEIELSAREVRLLLFLREIGLWRLAGPVIATGLYGVDLELLDVAIREAGRRREEER